MYFAKNMEKKYHETAFENFTWIDICHTNQENLDKIAKDYELDFFQIKDSLQVGHLPKYEKLTNYQFMILRAFSAKPGVRITSVNELSSKVAFFFSDKRVITIHRAKFDFMQNVTVNPANPEELVLWLIHKMTQTFESPSDLLSARTDEMERLVFLKKHATISLADLYYQKTQSRITKKLLQITQTVVGHLEVSDKSKTGLQDIKDRLLDLILTNDEVLEDSNSLLNSYLSFNSAKNNDVMKLLTIFSAFFLPLTFIVGVYGMNFKFMPELEWHYGYFISLGAMAAICIVIYLWFKRKRIL